MSDHEQRIRQLSAARRQADETLKACREAELDAVARAVSDGLSVYRIAGWTAYTVSGLTKAVRQRTS